MELLMALRRHDDNAGGSPITAATTEQLEQVCGSQRDGEGEGSEAVACGSRAGSAHLQRRPGQAAEDPSRHRQSTQ